jgi:hypothetical protein
MTGKIPVSLDISPLSDSLVWRKMRFSDYIIDESTVDWPQAVAGWRWLLPQKFTTWFMNRFGDLFLQTADGKIHWLRLDVGTLTCVAGSKGQFGEKLEDLDTFADWFLKALVDQLVVSGKTPGPGQCYGFIKIPMIGGAYTVENVELSEIGEMYALLGQAFEQMKDLPDGTPVEFIFKK